MAYEKATITGTVCIRATSESKQEARPVLFLDIDGVLNTRYLCQSVQDSYIDYEGFVDWNDWYGRQIDMVKVDLLNEICMATDCDVVISSAWRIFERINVPGLLNLRGFTGRVIGSTCKMPTFHSRAGEVQDWIRTDSVLNKRPAYCALDDANMKDCDFLVQTTFEEGLLPEHVEMCIRLLKGHVDDDTDREYADHFDEIDQGYRLQDCPDDLFGE